MRCYRQGDIVIREIPRLPVGAERQPDHILAHGEKTGHAHRLQGKGRIWRQDRRVYLTLDQPSCIVHEEHAPLAIPPGIYQIIGQREYVSPEEDRRIMD